MNLQDTIKTYNWVTADGGRLKLSEMTTLHLGNVLKMIWNHVCHRYNGTKVDFSNTYGRFTQMAEEEPDKMLDLCIILRHAIDKRPDVYTLDPWYPQIAAQLASGRPRVRHGQLLNGAHTRFKPVCEFYRSTRRAFHAHLDATIGGTNGLDLDSEEYEDEFDGPY
jgi:hypothetical protein